ncbi:uncharacterized protein LOC111640126 [Centruroides sculpturatus]|uniref:uncharacterized protein LOC111640126 n=1 Tax=Centruroides sculpturatus TaxID=218467 RepID=UPI000C6D6986|nr:uncharacterized protein LOC111640126 [Centruroides sculpturatus]
MKIIIFAIVGIILFERIDGLKKIERNKPSVKPSTHGANDTCSTSHSPLQKLMDIVQRIISKTDCNTCNMMNALTEICPVISNSTCFFACVLNELSQSTYIKFYPQISDLTKNIANGLKEIGIELKNCRNFQHIVKIIMSNFIKLFINVTKIPGRNKINIKHFME